MRIRTGFQTCALPIFNMCAGCKYPPELRNRASRAGLGSGPREAENPMRIEGDYAKDGYATIRRLVPPEVAANLFRQLEIDLAGAGKYLGTFAKLHPLSNKSTVDLSGRFYRPLTTSRWGL